MTVCLVDGTYQLHRTIHSDTGLRNSKGQPTGAIFIFLRILWNLKNIGKPVVVFDGAKSQYRMSIYPEYKKRPPKDETNDDVERKAKFDFSLEVLQTLLPRLGIPVVMLPEEGDDVLYVLAKNLAPKSEPVFVVSDDNDFLQFVNLGVKVFRPMKEQYVMRENFKDLFPFDPTYFTLYKALVGDKSDNINGVKGVGEVTATRIIAELPTPTIEALYDWCHAGDEKPRLKVKESFAIVKRNLLLMDLGLASLPEDLVLAKFEESKRRAVRDIDYVVNTFKALEFQALENIVTTLRIENKSENI